MFYYSKWWHTHTSNCNIAFLNTFYSFEETNYINEFTQKYRTTKCMTEIKSKCSTLSLILCLNKQQSKFQPTCKNSHDDLVVKAEDWRARGCGFEPWQGAYTRWMIY